MNLDAVKEDLKKYSPTVKTGGHSPWSLVLSLSNDLALLQDLPLVTEECRNWAQRFATQFMARQWQPRQARRLLWPVENMEIDSWADLGPCRHCQPEHGRTVEHLGREMFGILRKIFLEAEDEWLGDWYGDRQSLENPLAAVQMGACYVNPEGPNGQPDPALSAQMFVKPLNAWP